MSPRRHHAGGTRRESLVGCSRAVRAGNIVHVAGTTATGPDGRIVGVGDACVQTQQVLANIRAALAALDARIEDVVRTRIYLTDISRWEDVGRAHGEVFRDVRPVATMVEVARLIDPAMLAEIEAEAIIDGRGAGVRFQRQVTGSAIRGPRRTTANPVTRNR
ncbi:MAG: Rid family hydrolase [Gemmatimonadota bacterium]